MDSRDITENPSIKENFLEDIYRLQKGLLDHYIGIEGLPQYPIDVNTKTNQTLLKDFTSRIIEELAEGFEAQELVKELTEKHHLWNMAEIVHENYGAMLNHLQNVGEEQADALHFFVELLIYANIQPEDLLKFATNVSSPSALATINSSETLHILQVVGLGLIFEKYEELCHITPKNYTDLLAYYKDKKTEEDLDERYFTCASKYNSQVQESLKKILWDITYHLNISRNFLKNKPWKQSEVMTSEVKYQEQLAISFILLMGYLALLGCNASDVYFLYFKKNHVNQFRIKSKY